MKLRVGLVTALFATVAVLASQAGVAATAVGQPLPKQTTAAMGGAPVELPRAVLSERGAVLGGNPEAATGEAVSGIASNYAGTAGWIGEPTVALPGALGGRYDGEVSGYVIVCAERCARLPVVDWCECYWGTDDERIVDLSHAAWALITDAPLAEGLIEVRLLVDQ